MRHRQLQVERFGDAGNRSMRLMYAVRHRTVFDPLSRALEERQIDRVVADEAREEDQVRLGNRSPSRNGRSDKPLLELRNRPVEQRGIRS